MVIVSFILFLISAALCTINCWTATKCVQQGKDASAAVASTMFTFLGCLFALMVLAAHAIR